MSRPSAAGWCLLALLAAGIFGCAGSMRPIGANDRIGEMPAERSAFLVKSEILVPVNLAPDYVLPPGEYKPTHVDRFGIYYLSPSGVRQESDDGERVLPGGIHFPNEPDRYYSYPSLWVDFPRMGVQKLPLPDVVRERTWGTHLVFLYDGQPVQ